MAFCTRCGATVNGAFCVQCGTPAKAAAGQPIASPAGPPSASPPPTGPPPVGQATPQPVPGAMAPRRTSPLVWVLVAVLGLFVLIGVAAVGTLRYFVHKAGIDPDLMRRNPGFAIGKIIAAANPDAEVLSTDDSSGKITVRDRRTGKVVTLSFDDAKNGRFSFSAVGDDGKTASLEIGAGAGKLPSWVPAYPGADARGTFAVKGDDGNSQGEGGTFTFTTPDSAAKVKAFYDDRCRRAGMKVKMTLSTEESGVIVASDDGERHTLNVNVAGGSGDTTVTVIYAAKR
ncbi:MAG TPA: zinc ribbon domain-containing protein [Candidatus Acidoferrales bacterium]|nr:zinc ribbon domain-containing protein [Candidatus Acidoferrales bacterium]